jgi:transcriptional activator HAC1
MESWSAHTPSPSLKFENSPAESLLSTPSEMYPSLFGTDSTAPTTLNPLDMLTPKSFAQPDEGDVSVLGLSASTPAPETPSADADTPEKKPVKKRKSWGQVLPEPKTNLPPRKRAKTEDEKEQRRVERVLRNRRAAQSSRERKRQEVEGLERRNKELEAMLRDAQQANRALVAELCKVRGPNGALSRPPTSFDALRPSPVTFSQELFSSQDGHSMATEDASSIEQLLTTVPNTNSNTTVNPAALSPTLTPVLEEEDEEDEHEADEHDEPSRDSTPLADAAAPKVGSSPDATQHPAVSVGGSASFGVASDVAATVALDPSSLLGAPGSSGVDLEHGFSLPAAFDADRYVLESGLLASPNSSDFEYDHLVGDDAQSFTFAPTNEFFDISDFITEDPSVVPTHEQLSQHPSHSRAVADSSFFNLETQVSSEDSYLQPQSGASLDGCDDGGIAVSVI